MKENDTPNAVVAFGEFLRDSRKKLGLPSRTVAVKAGMQPSNYCRLENGSLKPPQDREKLKLLLKALDLSGDPVSRAEFFDLAAKANDDVPQDLADIITRNEAVPMVLRTIENRRLTKDQVEKLLDLVMERDEQLPKKKKHST
jgi:transcriptional regulator with XRE-family HTH domain